MDKRYNSEEWYVWEQNACPMLLIMTLNPSFKNLRDYFGSCLFNTLVVFETDSANNYQAKWILRFDEGRILGQKMVDLLLCPPYMVAFNSGVEVSEERLMKKANEILANHAQYGVGDIPHIFNEFCELYYAYYRLGAFTEPVQWHTEYLLTNYLNNHYEGALSPADALKVLLVTEEDSFSVDILRNLRECAELLDRATASDTDLAAYINSKKGLPDFASQIASYIFQHKDNPAIVALIDSLDSHSKQYHWKNNNYYATRFVAPIDVLADLLDPHHFEVGKTLSYFDGLLQTIAESKQKQLEQKREVFAELPAYYQNIVSIANNVGASLIDHRKKNVMICNSAFDVLLSVVAEATGASIEELHLLIPQELEYYIQDPKSYTERFEERKKIFICLQSDFTLVDEEIDPMDVSSAEDILKWKVSLTTDPFIAEGECAEQALEKLNLRMNLFEASSTDVEKLQGVTAFFDVAHGVIEGVVKIIKNPKIESLNAGEILVAPSTTPDYISAINKSAAIITDWGGQTSHAAIVAREMKKPCIIGTNYASQILRSGQRVRIDFAQGTIEIIN